MSIPLSVAATISITVAGTSRTLVGVIVNNDADISLIVTNAAGTGVQLVKNPTP